MESAKPHVTKLRLNYSFRSPGNGILYQSGLIYADYLIGSSEATCPRDPCRLLEGK